MPHGLLKPFRYTAEFKGNIERALTFYAESQKEADHNAKVWCREHHATRLKRRQQHAKRRKRS